MRIADLARPRLPWWFAAANRALRPLARSARFARFDADELLETARRRTGLADFGPESFQTPFRLVVECLNQAGDLSALGRISQRGQLLRLLTLRLRIQAQILARPEILAERIERPIIIAGLPRSGTTHLFNLAATHPALRHLPWWESLEPIPGPRDRGGPARTAPRIRRARRGLAFLHSVMPLFPAMHELEAEAPHEEVQLQMMEFATQLFETTLHAPRYAHWLRNTDQTPHYAYLKRMLQLCQHLRRGRGSGGSGGLGGSGGPGGSQSTPRWILKSPQHLENLPALFATFPDALLVQTHRDPTHIAASLATMVAYGLRLSKAPDRIDPARIAAYWAERIEGWLHRAIAHRPLAQGRILDIPFHHFMANDTATATRLLDWANVPQTPETRAALHALAARNPRHKHGRITYDYTQLALNPTELRARYRFYTDHFNLPREE